MTMLATVLRVEPRGLLVRDSETGQEFFVNYANTGSLRPGDTVRITYTGTMTPSIPPQISATAIARLASQQPEFFLPAEPQQQQSEIRRATILRIDRNTLYVRDPSNFRQVIVRYPYAHHFCVRQRVNIRYDSITLSDPLQVTATDVFPIC